MPNVQLFVKQENKWITIFVIDEDLAVAHLKTVRDEVVKYHPTVDPKKVQLHGAGSGPLIWVLKLVVKHKDQLHLKIGDRMLPKAIAIHQAVQALGVQPPQPQVEGHVVGHIAHNKITPEDISAIHTAYGDVGAGSRCWSTAVNQLGWFLTKDLYSPVEEAGVVKQLVKYPELYDAVIRKRDDLVQLNEEFEQGLSDKKKETASSKGLTGHRDRGGKARRRGGYNGKNSSFQDTSHGFSEHAVTTGRDGMDSRPVGLDGFPLPQQPGFGTAHQKVIEDIDQLQLTAEHHLVTQSGSTQSDMKDLELTVRSLEGGGIISRASKVVHATSGVEKVQVNVIFDSEKMGSDEVQELMARWTNEIGAIFESRD